MSVTGLPELAAQVRDTVQYLIGVYDAKIAELTKDRDGWKQHAQMYERAWQRELIAGNALPAKTYTIDACVLGTRRLITERERLRARVHELETGGSEAIKAARENARLGW